MTISFSPLRYPDGKQILARILAHLIKLNDCEGGVYIEPYAGGAGAALSLLFGEYVRKVVINDADNRIFAFWNAVLNHTNKFLNLLRDTPLTVDEWKRQRNLYLKPGRCSQVRLGFATFYLNRCNRSGIIGNAGMIGGVEQTGKWKLDARFNREDLAQRIERIARYRDRITLSNLDAQELLKALPPEPSKVDRVFIYLDPPYYCKGSQLYLNYYKPEDHRNLANYLSSCSITWTLSYDNVPQIRRLYQTHRKISFNLGYSARECKIGKELLIIPPHLQFPTAWPRRIPDHFVSSAGRISVPMPTEASTAS